MSQNETKKKEKRRQINISNHSVLALCISLIKEKLQRVHDCHDIVIITPEEIIYYKHIVMTVVHPL